jgi:hypothetical protein
MTLPDTPFVCKNIDAIWWCEEHRQRGIRDKPHCQWAELADALRQFPLSMPECRMVERGLVDLSEVIPAEVESRINTYEEALELDPPAPHIRVRYTTNWQPVVSDKE